MNCIDQLDEPPIDFTELDKLTIFDECKRRELIYIDKRYEELHKINK